MLPAMAELKLPPRSGPRPQATPTNPHQQLDQQPPDARLAEELARRVFSLPGVEDRPSLVSVPGARALWLSDSLPAGPPEAFMVGREFAHLHPLPDLSLHAMLPPPLAVEAVATEWAEPHPMARLGLIPPGAVMLYAPRDEGELEVVERLVDASYGFARGTVPLKDRRAARPLE